MVGLVASASRSTAPRATTIWLGRRNRHCPRFALERHDLEFANRSWTESSNEQIPSRSRAKLALPAAIANFAAFLAMCCRPRRKRPPLGAENCQRGRAGLTKRSRALDGHGLPLLLTSSVLVAPGRRSWILPQARQEVAHSALIAAHAALSQLGPIAEMAPRETKGRSLLQA